MLTTIKSWIQEHPYCLAILYFIPYLICFELLEAFVVPKFYIYSSLDELIPFQEIFIIPYLLWFPLLAISLGYFLFHSKEEFLNLCYSMFAGMSISLFIYLVLPNGLNLRLETTHQNILTTIVQALYSIDTPTNVCPSIHVATTLSILFAILHSTLFQHPRFIKICSTLLCLSICMSTMFLKQHSIIDAIAGGLLSLVLYYFAYYTNWKRVIKPITKKIPYIKRYIS